MYEQLIFMHKTARARLAAYRADYENTGQGEFRVQLAKQQVDSIEAVMRVEWVLMNGVVQEGKPCTSN